MVIEDDDKEDSWYIVTAKITEINMRYRVSYWAQHIKKGLGNE